MPDERTGTALASPLVGGTKIEWADFTFNPWWGCERVSPGCAHCYADAIAHQRQPGKNLWGAGHEFRFFGDKHWDEPLKWARLDPAKLGRRPRVFCASMADVFEDRDELEEHRLRLFNLIDETPALDWLVLTKRPEDARDWLSEWTQLLLAGEQRSLPPNLWLGVSIENSRFTWRADVLREIPAAVRFISAEPLLGSLFRSTGITGSKDLRAPLDLTGIAWVIIGGESGPKSRPFHLEHARELIETCLTQCPHFPDGCIDISHRPAVFVKQLGAKPIDNHGSRMTITAGAGVAIGQADVALNLHDRKGGDPTEWPADLRIREHPRSVAA